MDGRRWLDAVREPAWKLDAAARRARMSNSSSQLVDPEIATVDCLRVAQSSTLMKMFRRHKSLIDVPAIYATR